MSTVLQIVLPRIPRTATSLCGGGDDTKEWRKMWRCWLRLTDGKYGRAAGEHAHSHVGTLLFVIHSCALSRNSVRQRRRSAPQSAVPCLYKISLSSALAPIQVRVQQWLEWSVDWISAQSSGAFFSMDFRFFFSSPSRSGRFGSVVDYSYSSSCAKAFFCCCVYCNIGVFRIISLLAARHSSLFSFAILQDLGTCFVLQRRPLSHGIEICRCESSFWRFSTRQLLSFFTATFLQPVDFTFALLK